MSNEKIIDDIYSKINEVALPGDLLFYISQYQYDLCYNDKDSKTWMTIIKPMLKPWCKRWLGVDAHDYDAWHVGIIYMMKKRKKHSRINPWIIHSTSEKGVHISQLSPKNFTIDESFVSRRIELLSYEQINEAQRKKIIDFSYSRIGSEFDKCKRRLTLLPYICGLPNLYYNQSQFSCQQLVIASYAAAGIYFTHPFTSFPIFNIGRYLGHPLGHSKDSVNPRYPYLMDHHIYRDPRFIVKAVIYQEPETGKIRLERENLQKYSWSETLKEKYLKWIQ
jgi:hypothetical protein